MTTKSKQRMLKNPYADLLPPLKTSEREALAAGLAMKAAAGPAWFVPAAALSQIETK